ncbi:ShlB/FhaC/HecB family hemolysin secretion/activation protein [Desulfovibrio litoralis]|uniref:Hemolysin activation/secretion protein n=1 Tax=Desulfovibrio litoralis DSM 11393 TaxID=1121455 RepID=A0A1M7TGR3_9BACT|nr:ShlB/FhaC/HecB family hemolysin secretion/activation protein [Desulfovibrio litoralis]SHN69917.1 Hemolysin activation/secretion protein [Desulfovibrio litoralis DSM 11393]
MKNPRLRRGIFIQRNAPERPGLQPKQFEKEPEQANAPCVEVHSIRLEGATLISPSTLAVITKKYENQCLSLAQVNNILRDITNAYIERGYVTARAFVKPSSNEPGVLDILILEGTLEKVLINEGDKNYYYRGYMAFPGLEGKPLNLRDIEQGLDQLNRLPSQQATMELAPGEKLGGTVVNVKIPPKRSWRFGGGVDNLGQRSSGEWQYNLFLEKDNLLGVGDQFAVYWNADSPLVEQSMENRSNEGHNQSFSSFASIPWGKWTFSANMSRFSYESNIHGMNADYSSTGTTDTHSVQAERLLYRNADSKTSLSVALTNRDVKNYIEEEKLIASSYVLTTLTTSLSHNRRFLGGSLGGSLDHTQGLPILGTKEEEDHGHSIPRGDFHKFSSSVYWYRPIEVEGQSFYYHLSAYGQLTKHTLYGAERISIGSRNSVRGFHEESATGDQGGYVRNEAGWNIPFGENTLKYMPFNNMQVYTAYDLGHIIKDKNDPFERGSLDGVSLGLRTQGDLAFDLTASKPLNAPSYIDKNDTEIYFSLRYTF